MNNTDRATHIIAAAVGDGMLTHSATQALADAGLLAPELPEPDKCPKDIPKPGWHIDLLNSGEHAGVFIGSVRITDLSGWAQRYTPEEIRAAAYKLLAAANAAEESRA